MRFNLRNRAKALGKLKKLGVIRFRANPSEMLFITALVLILFIAFTIRLLPLKWEIQLGSLHLSEFDPYHQYRYAKMILENGLNFNPEVWVHKQSWYPSGFDVTTTYPGLPLTTAILYTIFTALVPNISLMSFCAILPAVLGMLSCLVLYFIGKEIGGKPVGLLASMILALSPSFIQRTQVG